MGLLNGIGIGFPFFQGGVAREVTDYLARVAADSGTVDDVEALKDLVEFYKRQGTLDLTQLFAAPFLGSKVRTSGIYKYLSKLYSVELPANDLAQTTELNQPYQSGNIAPSEVLSMQNPNGDARYLTHPAISFAANQAWSVTIILNNNYKHTVENQWFIGDDSVNWIFGIATASKQYSFYKGGYNLFNSCLPEIGKNSILTLIANGSGSLSLYVNSVLNKTISANTQIALSRFVNGYTNLALNGTAHFYRIQSGAMTATQVLAEYNKLRTYIPEIETVLIGSKYITSSNFQAVATPAGNVIQEMQAASAVEKITNAADREFSSDTGWWTKKSGAVIEDGVCKINTSSSVYQIIYKTGVVTVSKYVKYTFTILGYGSGALRITDGNSDYGTFNSNGTYSMFIKPTSQWIGFTAISVAVLQIDNVSVKELGWSDAEELYNGLIAQGYTAANALKEVAMWCSYENSTANQAIYGKFYNDYAIQLLNTDMAAQNFGYHIATEAEKAEILAAYTDANDLKKEGTDYWDNALGTNASGLTLLGTGCRMPDGSFASIKKVGGFATSDGNVSKQLGLPIRLIRD